MNGLIKIRAQKKGKDSLRCSKYQSRDGSVNISSAEQCCIKLCNSKSNLEQAGWGYR
uniref:Uncharacterized protein n=1 Tax=Anguilla anguilla TaxID=7936 RepID=A0A0E9U4H3_ANGAN